MLESYSVAASRRQVLPDVPPVTSFTYLNDDGAANVSFAAETSRRVDVESTSSARDTPYTGCVRVQQKR